MMNVSYTMFDKVDNRLLNCVLMEISSVMRTIESKPIIVQKPLLLN